MTTNISNRERFIESAFPETEHGFSIGEFRARHQRVREAMAAAKVDVLYVSAPESIAYLTGYQAEWYHGQSSSRWPAFSGVALHVDHDRWIHFEVEDELILTRITSVSEDIRIGSDTDHLASIISDLKAENWVGTGITVGLETGNYRPNRNQSEMFEAALRAEGSNVTDATQIVRTVRRVKSQGELAHIRTAQRIADIGMTAAREHLSSGMTELDLYAEIVYAMARAGGENPGITMPVASGAKSACVHALASRRKIMAGDIVNVDVSGVYHRYHANMARTFSVGEPTKAVHKTVEDSLGALEIVQSMLRPGVRCLDLINELETFYREHNLWEERWWVGGYELGIAFPPDWVGEFVYDETSDPEEVFVENEVLNFEANFYLPDHAGLTMGINTFIVGAEGAEFLQSTPNEFFVVTPENDK